jgi:hypothetical protein
MRIKASGAGLADTWDMQATASLSVASTSVSVSSPATAAFSSGSVFLPKEHGSWSLALEPLALGLLVAPSQAGGALALAALAGFFARRPFKALFSPATARRRGVRIAVVIFSSAAGIALAIALALGGLTPLWPLLLAAPLGALFAWFDAQNGSRAAAAEVAGSAAFAIVPVVLATLAGWSAWPALALGALALTRSVPTVLTVRCSLRRSKGEAVGFTLPVFVAAAASALISLLAALQLVPAWAGLPGWILFGRTLWFACSFRPVWPARRVGMFEAILGLIYISAIAIAYGCRAHAGL